MMMVRDMSKSLEGENSWDEDTIFVFDEVWVCKTLPILTDWEGSAYALELSRGKRF